MQLFLETYVNHTGSYSRSLWKFVTTCDFCHWHCHWRTKLASFENAYLTSIMISSFYQRSTHSDIPVRNNNNSNNTGTIHRPNTTEFLGEHISRSPVSCHRNFPWQTNWTQFVNIPKFTTISMSESVLSGSLPSPSKMYLAATAAV